MKEVIRFTDQQTMSSLDIALVTGKRHSDVLEAIRNMEPAWEKVAQRKFPLGSYKDANNQSRPCYYLNKRECLYIATKFNDEARAKLVIRWEELEQKQRTSMTALPNFSNPAEAARAWAEQFELKQLETKRADEAESQVLALTQEIETMQPKVVFADAVVGSSTNILVRDLAKLIQQNGCNIGEVRMYRWLREKKYLALNNRPMQRYMEQGLFFISEGTHSENGVLKSHFTTKVTPKGQQYFLNLFINNNALFRQ